MTRFASRLRMNRGIRLAHLFLALAAALAAPLGCGGGAPRFAGGPDARRGAAELLAVADSTLASGAHEEALEGYRSAARRAEMEGDRALLGRAAVGVGLAALLTGNARESHRSLLRAVEIDPRSAPAYVGLGRYFTAARRYHDAKEALERAESLDPSSPEPRYHLGVAFLQAGRPVEAIQSFQRALERDPGHAPARDAVRPLLEERFRALGIPPDYGDLLSRTTVSRGELGVMLAVELGADPARPEWRSSNPAAGRIPQDVEGAWGMSWLRASVERGLIAAYPDGLLHVGDPVSRGTLAVLVATLERRLGRGNVPADPAAGSVPEDRSYRPDRAFPDLGPRHFLSRPAGVAAALGLPVRTDGRFDPQASASGGDVLRVLRGLARRVGAESVLPPELAGGGMVE